ncbi:hypothetical protein GR925_36535 [Streptomyces sp. HUCO-GS316]|uniref:hypothetical protein n=1 Tax=Streptomyces sp. HUCO-GS316 TaxID=2692198 RepID=UPI00136C677D|nr:hypothetical protein [Streptomyces sp. HUCO-GS316]MXM68769.1 hypothetical protein [Streptomyces sp. HUCO-GS316]
MLDTTMTTLLVASRGGNVGYCEVSPTLVALGLGQPVDSVGCDTAEHVPLSLNVRRSTDERAIGLKIKSMGVVAWMQLDDVLAQGRPETRRGPAHRFGRRGRHHPFGHVVDRTIRTIRKPHLPRDRRAGSGPNDVPQEKDALHAERSAP